VKILRLLVFAFAMVSGSWAAAPLALHPENPHYFLFRGQPTIIITSGEHYGAVLNLDFDYVSYLDELQSRQLNSTRTFTGAYLEPQGAFNIADNTLAPANGRYIGPWPRTGAPGATHGGNKFELTRWNDSYFARLRDFVRQASARGVIVELNLFCPFYEEAQWKLSPMNAINNVNNIGAVARTNVYTLDKHGGLLAIQEALVRKIVVELNQFDNLYYEICNEPYFGGVALDWQRHIAEVIVEAERTLPNKHLISQNIANGSAAVFNTHPAVSIFNFHYAAPPDAVAVNYGLNKVIGDNETGFRGTNDLPYRREAWEFILAGGGLFNNLDYSFTVRHPRGTFVNYPAKQPGGGNPAYREQLRILRNFMSRFDFLRMQPVANVIKSGLPAGATSRVLAQDGKAYAIYLGPAAPVNADKFSVRWTGKLRVPRAGDYTFYARSNDGVRVSIDGQLLIDNWVAHSDAEDKGTLTLRPNKSYNITVEYFQSGGNAVMQLAWQFAAGPRGIITPDRFLTSRNATGLDAEYYFGQNFDTLAFKRTDPQINFDWTAKSPFAPTTAAGTMQTTRLELELPRGQYTARWLNTRTGAYAKTERFSVRRATETLTSPAYDEDIALEIHPAPGSPFKRILDISP
jgi:hypothetical protein